MTRFGFVFGIVAGLLLGGVALIAQGTIDTTPATRLAWDQPAANVTEAGQYRVTAYTGANADKVLADVNDATAVAFGVLSFTCSGAGATAGTFACTSTTTAGQLAGTSNPGTYRTVLVVERRRADGTYAARAVGQLCTFRFADTAPSLAPTNLRFVP